MNWNKFEQLLDRALLVIAVGLAAQGFILVTVAIVIVIVEAGKLLGR